MLSESERLAKQIKSIESQLESCPEGKLICSHNENRYKWYQRDGKSKIYIPKSNRTLAEQLAIKKYLSLLKEDLSKEKRAIDSYLKHHASDVGKAEKLLTETSEYKNLLTPYFKPLSQELSEWANASYERNTNHSEHLKIQSVSGNYVRSKSEAIIDMLLHINKIPFRYECALRLGEFTIYPDFTIRHPKTGEVFCWEHFGLMDNLSYSKNVVSKLQLYISNNIIPSIQLITTYETQKNPLCTDMVEKIIEEYFL